jgi:hypothetical protein
MKIFVSAAAFLLILAPRSFGCATSDLISSWKGQGIVATALPGRPEMQTEWVTPDGRFKIHYDIIGDRAVFQAELDVDPADGIPDYVNRIGDYLALSYDSLVGSLNFDPPPSDGFNGGDGLYDIYLTESLGLTTPEEPSDEYPGHAAYTSFIQMRFAYGSDPIPQLKATTSHEFFHAIEFAYRAYSEDITPWWFESCANWAEEKVFDDLNLVYFNLPAYMLNPQQSLYLTNGQFIYGAWLVPEFFDERLGPDFIRESWEKFAQFDFAITALEFALFERGLDFNDEYCQHVIWNYFTGLNYRDGFYSEGADFGCTVFEARTYDSYPVNWSPQPVPLQNLASTYIVFKRDYLIKGALMIEYINRTEARQMVCLAVVRSSGMIQTSINPIESGVLAAFEIPDFGAVEKVIMAPVWIYEGNPRHGSTSYDYRAFIDSAGVGIAEGNGPIAGYSLDGAYPNPFNGAVSISFKSRQVSRFDFSVYDINGRLLLNKRAISKAGSNTINWEVPSDFSSGLLFYIIDFKTTRLFGKMSLLK